MRPGTALPNLSAAGLVLAFWPHAAHAAPVGTLGEDAVRLDVTEAATVSYNADNRNDRASDVTRFADDDWGLAYNRLNAQASAGRFQLGLRLDGAWFFASPDAAGIGLDILRERNGGTLPATFDDEDADIFVGAVRQADAELSNRYVNWLVPAKYYAGYASPDVEATVGDFYAQFGRGFVLSVRKLDELSSDTTIRGVRATGRLDAGGLRWKLTGLGGVANPLRIDESSGRYLSVDDRVADGVARVAEAGMPWPVDSAFEPNPRPTYSPDRIVAAQIEGSTDDVRLALQGSLIDRRLVDWDGDGIDDALSPGVLRSAQRVATGSVSLDVPRFAKVGAGYVEAAFQLPTYPSGLRDADDSRPEREQALPESGYAVYASVNLAERPVTLTFEGKQYRSFFPLAANIDIERAREFSAVQYNAPPTAEAFWVDTELEGFNTCTTGGRLRSDVQVGRDESVFAWVGRFYTWSESVTNERCRIEDDNENAIWDFATGLEMTAQGRRSRASTALGARFDAMDREVVDPASGSGTHVFYREEYLRYDLVKWLGGPFSLVFQGWHRRRRQTVGGPEDPWFESQHLTALAFAPHLTAGFGVEYDGNPQFPATYFSGQATYNVTSDSNVSLFVGQRRGGLRCVSGVCRVFPPFEGVRVDATVRF